MLGLLPKSGLMRRGAVSTLGFFMPVCECGNVPLSRSLIIQGLKPSEAIAFLLAAPVLNPVTIWSTWAAFSFDPAIVYSRIIGTVLIAWVISYVISLKKKEQEFLTDSFVKTCNVHRKKNASHKHKHKPDLPRFARHFSAEAYTMIKLLAFGAIVAGLVQTFIPREILLSIGSNVVLSILAMLLLAFVVSICANVDAFFALAFANTFSAGSIVSFLVFGPMIDIKMIALLRTTFTKELIIVVSLLALSLSALTGLVVTYAF